MTQISALPIRLRYDLDLRTMTPVGTPARVWRGNDVDFSVGVYYRGAPLDLANIAQLALTLHSRRNPTGGTLAQVTLNAIDLTATLSSSDWENNISQHGIFRFSSAQMNQSLGGLPTADFWLSLSGLTNAGKVVTFGAGIVAIDEDNAGDDVPPPPVPEDGFYTKGEINSLLLNLSFHYMGTLDASIGTYPSTGTLQARDYFIVNVAGTISGTTYAIADRAEWTGSAWVKVPQPPVALPIGSITEDMLVSYLRQLTAWVAEMKGTMYEGGQNLQALAYAITDSVGKVLFGLRYDGTAIAPFIAKDLIVAASKAVTDLTLVNVVSNPQNLAYAIADSTGQVLFGLRYDGTAIAPFVSNAISSALSTSGITALADLMPSGVIPNPQGIVYAVTDSNGQILFGLKMDGTAIAPFLDSAISRTGITAIKQVLLTDSMSGPDNFAYAITDSTGKVLFGLKYDGSGYAPWLSQDAAFAAMKARVDKYAAMFLDSIPPNVSSIDWGVTDSTGKVLFGLGYGGNAYAPWLTPMVLALATEYGWGGGGGGGGGGGALGGVDVSSLPGVTGAGTSTDPYVGWDTYLNAHWLPNTTYDFKAGIWSGTHVALISSESLKLNHISLRGVPGKTVWKLSGNPTPIAVSPYFDGTFNNPPPAPYTARILNLVPQGCRVFIGSGDLRPFGIGGTFTFGNQANKIRMSDIIIDGVNSSTGEGLLLRQCHWSDFINIRFRNVETGILLFFAVGVSFYDSGSNSYYDSVGNMTYGTWCGRDPANPSVGFPSAVEFFNHYASLSMNGSRGTGLHIESGQFLHFWGGVSEGNAKNLILKATGPCSFNAVDFEGGPSTDGDITAPSNAQALFTNCCFQHGFTEGGTHEGITYMHCRWSYLDGVRHRTILSGAVANVQVALSAGSGTVSVNPYVTNSFKAPTITGALTIDATNGGTAGQKLTFILPNDATLSRVVTFGANFKSAGTIVGTVNKTATITFESDGVSFFEVARTLNL